MCAELAAAYCGEPTVEAFIGRVGREYPQWRISERRRRLWLQDDLDQAILPPDLALAARPRRGSVTMTLPLPRYVIAKMLVSSATGLYFTVPTRYRKMGWTIPNEPLGSDYAIACGVDGKGGRAAALNGLFGEWWKIKNGEPVESLVRYGTVDWLFREYKNSKRYRERVSQRTRRDYELLMQIVLDLPTKRGDRVGQRPVKSITPARRR